MHTRESAGIRTVSYFLPGHPFRNVVGGREKCLHANQTTQRPFRDANDECQPTGAGRGAHLALLGAALGLLRQATGVGRVLSGRLSTPGRHPKTSGFDVTEGRI